MSPAEVMQLALIAAHLSGYSMPTGPVPAVVEVSSEAMHRMACDRDAPVDDPCWDVIGRYVDGGGAIYVDMGWVGRNPEVLSEKSIVFHELVHWLQFEHGKGGVRCPHLLAREVEAYRVQTHYIVQYEHRKVDLRPPEETCR